MFRPLVLDGDPDPLLACLSAGIRAVDPRRCVAAVVGRREGDLLVDAEPIRLTERPIRVLALGKAAVGMTWGLRDALGGHPMSGLAATPVPGPAPAGITVMAGGHPVPDHRSVAAGERLLEEAAAAGSDDLVVVLVSGGGSACAEAPVAGIAIESLARLNRLLLASGAPIEDVNTVRRSLSLLKGGGLAAAAVPATVITVAISDVAGNHLPTIAGGPTVPDPTGPAEALLVLEQYGLMGDVDPGLLAGLDSGEHPAPQPGRVVIAADGGTAARAAASTARDLGIDAAVVSTDLTGPAHLAGRRFAAAATTGRGPAMQVFAGETTVELGDAPGVGGRNQEVALAAAEGLRGTSSVVASLGTDGIDGPTTAAGGVVDGGTIERGRRAGLDAPTALRDHDSGRYLEEVGGRLVCGPTGTNVGDLMVAWRR